MNREKSLELVDAAVAADRALTRDELLAVAAAARAEKALTRTETVTAGRWVVEYRDRTATTADRHEVSVWLAGTEGRGDGGYGLCHRRVGLYPDRAAAERAAANWLAANGDRLAAVYAGW